MAQVVQPSFAKGEIGEELFGRVDTAMYQVALKKARNVIISAQGGVSNRPGTQFIGPVKDHTKLTYVIPFKFKTTDTYVLEFGNLYIRVVRNDGHVVEAAKVISNITKADPAVVTTGTHNYVNGDEVFIETVVGMTEVNQRRFTITVLSGTTFSLQDQVTGVDVDSTAFTAYSSAGTSERVFEIATPYLTADLPILKYTQDKDVMTLTHPTYGVRELTRTDHDAWTLTEPTFAPTQDHPVGQTVVARTAAAETERYRVTGIAIDTFEESLPALSNVTTASASATNVNPVVVTAAGHPYVNGDEIEINGYNEMTEVNGRRFIVANKATNTFELLDEDGTSYLAETTGGNVNATFVKITNGNATIDNDIAWTALSGAGRYAVYREKNGLYGLIGETELTTFFDDAITVDLSISPPSERNPFRVANDFPGAAGYFEQRRVFGGSLNRPDTQFFSQTGNQSNMTSSQPTQADDAITATLNANQVNEIRHFVPGNDLVILTDGSEWRVNSGSNQGFAADTIKQKPQTKWGSSHLVPVVIGSTILFVQENLTGVRTIGFSFEVDGYLSSDMNLLAPHIFDKSSALDWAFMATPQPVIPVVRGDGTVAALTFMQEQEVIAWATWDTLGKFETVTAIRPDAVEVDDAAYFVVQRKDGSDNTVRYIERTHTRRFTEVEDAFFVDSGLTLDTPLAITAITAADPVVVTSGSHNVDEGDDIDIHDVIWVSNFDEDDNETQPDQLNGNRFLAADVTGNTITLVENEDARAITGATQADPVVVTALAHGKSNGDSIGIFDVLGMVELNGNTYKVANVTDDTFELTDSSDVDINGTGFTAYTSAGNVYKAIDGSVFNAYVEDGNVREPFLVVGGARHLAGLGVAVLADGNVVPNITVSATGTITLPRAASRIHLGLKFISDVQTLAIELPGTTVSGKKKKVTEVAVKFARSRGLLIGPDSSRLIEMKQRENEVMGAPTALLSGTKVIKLKSSWDRDGSIFMRQRNPLPMTILSVTPDLDIGDE